jgi:hypothetical protein
VLCARTGYLPPKVPTPPSGGRRLKRFTSCCKRHSERMQVRSAAARTAIAAYAARPNIAVRAAPETERAVFARLNGRPNDDDMVAVFVTGEDKQYRDRWAAVRRGVILTAKESVIVRNEISEGDAPSDRQAAKTYKTFAHPRADILADAKTAIHVDYTGKNKVYFYDALCVGVAKFARVKVDFVTDDAALAKALSAALPRAPKSAIPRFHQPLTTGLLLHSSTKDEQAGGLDAYLMYDTKLAVARGALPSIAPVMDAFADMAASRLLAKEVLVVKGDIQRDDKSGAITLVLGEAANAAGSSIQGAKYAAWGAAGVSRLFEGTASATDLTVQALPGKPLTNLPVPKRIVFATKKDGKAKQLSMDDAKKLLEKCVIGPADKIAPVFEKLVQASKIELAALE